MSQEWGQSDGHGLDTGTGASVWRLLISPEMKRFQIDTNSATATEEIDVMHLRTLSS